MTTKSKTARPGNAPSQRGEQMRNTILIEALNAFAEYGYEAMSVRELTRRLNVSHNIVHHHFGSKKDLWRAAVEFGIKHSRDELLSIYKRAEEEGASDPNQVISDTITQGIYLFAQFPALPKIIAIESSMPSERLDFLFDEFVKPISDSLGEYIASANKAGAVKIDPRIVTLYILGGVPALFTHAGLAMKFDGLDHKSGFVLEHYTDTVIEILSRGLLK